jgi:uncharacterized protein (TIGR03437 family)
MKNLPLAAALVLITLLGSAAGQGPTLRVVNAGSLLPDDLAPGSMVTIMGTNLSNINGQAPDPLNPFNVLNGVSVKIGNTPVGLLYVSSTQINGVIDASTPVGANTLTVVSPIANLSVPVNIQRTAAPALFAATGAGSRDGAILNAVNFARGPFSVTTQGATTYLALYLTSLDLSVPPTVTIGGLPATVQFYGAAPCCLGLSQINVQLPAALAGAGRTDVIVTSGGRSSNAVEVVVLPSSVAENTPRNREIGDIAYVQALGVTLVLDEQDDLIRVIDMKQRTVTRLIALAGGAQPFAIAVNDAGTQAVVAERGRGKVAVIDLARGVVITEIPVGGGPSGVAIDGDQVVVANEDTDTVSVLSLVLKQVLATIPVGRSPRSVAIDDTTTLAYVANQNSGNISVVDLGKRAVIDTLPLAANAHPRTVRVIPPGGMLAVTEPDAGVVDLFDLPSKARYTARMIASDVVFQQKNAYLTNQIGAAASTAALNVAPGTISLGTPATIALDPGLRAAAVDVLDNLLLVSSEASGTVTLIDLFSNKVTGTISAVRAPGEAAGIDDRSDRDRAANTPVITSIVPAQAAAGSTVQLVVNGSNVGGAFDAFFPGPGYTVDRALTITGIDVDPGGGQVRMTVQIAPGATKGEHLLRVFTPNGENSLTIGSGSVLNVL